MTQQKGNYWTNAVFKHIGLYFLAVTVGTFISTLPLAIYSIILNITKGNIIGLFLSLPGIWFLGMMFAVCFTSIPYIICLIVVKTIGLQGKTSYICSGIITAIIAFLLLFRFVLLEHNIWFLGIHMLTMIIAGAISGLLYYKLDNKFTIKNP